MLTRRIIPCLDVKDGQVVKGVRFRDHVVMGGIEELALRYRDAGADELVFYDITASPEGRSADVAWVERLARHLDIPFCVAGGIRSVEQARRVLAAGADKISVNSPALERPELIDELSAEFGVQCIVVGIDSSGSAGDWRVHQYTGDPNRSRELARLTPGLGRGSPAPRRRRDRAQLHGQRRRAPRLRHRAAASRARGLPRAADRLRRCRHAGALPRRVPRRRRRRRAGRQRVPLRRHRGARPQAVSSRCKASPSAHEPRP